MIICMPNDNYPASWLRWVRQQLVTAIAVELSVRAPERYAHLRNLPVTVTGPVGGESGPAVLRELIHLHAPRRGVVDATGCSEDVADALLSSGAVIVDEPDLVVMLAWRLAQLQMCDPTADLEMDGHDENHVCCDPEVLARELVASGLVAPGWKRAPQRHPAPVDGSSHRTRRPARRTRRSPPVVTGQLVLPW